MISKPDPCMGDHFLHERGTRAAAAKESTGETAQGSHFIHAFIAEL